MRSPDFELSDALEAISDHQPDMTLSEYYRLLIDRLDLAGRMGTKNSYKLALAYFEKFNGGNPLSWSTVTVSWLNRAEAAHLGRGRNLNGLSVQMRSLRAVINKAISESIYQGENPFLKYKIKQTDTRKRALSLTALKKIKDFKIPPTDPLALSRDLFMVSFYLQGMNFVDLAQLTQDNIVDDHIEYTRQKTHQHITVKIAPPAKEIILSYQGQGKKDLLFPLLDPTDKTIPMYTQGLYRNKKYNKDLKTIATRCKLPPFTGYAARHSWASLANERQIPITAITQALGQRSVRTTQIYLDQLSRQQMDQTTDQMADL